MRTTITALLVAGLALAASPVAEKTATTPATDAITIPRLLSYQGKLLDNLGNPVIDTTYSVLFSLYTVPSGGTAFWGETQMVRTRGGLFSVLLGSVTPISALPDAGALYLGTKVGADPEMTTRLRIVSAAYAYLTERAANSDRLQGKDTLALDWRYVKLNQVGSISSAMIADGAIIAEDLHYMGATPGQMLKWNGTAWAPADDIVGGGDAWVRGSPDSVLFTVRELGIARGGSLNGLMGPLVSSHTNLGSICTTGVAGQYYRGCAVGGGAHNIAAQDFATAAGGYGNRVTGAYASIGGGEMNQADAFLGTVGGGHNNNADDTAACVAGGFDNWANWPYSFVGGGYSNRAERGYATLAGGYDNSTYGDYATLGGGQGNMANGNHGAVLGGYNNLASGSGSGHTVGGGRNNTASGSGGDAVVAGGYNNTASGSSSAIGGGTGNWVMADEACIPGGRSDSVSGNYGFATNYHSVVGASFNNSACFNSEYVTASNQLRCANLSVSGAKAFTIDHPADPSGKILNHYCVESPEMLVEYRGKATIGPDGRVDVTLPAYFAALAREPMVQLTGVGTYEVFVAEKVTGNRFAIGGKPGTEVYWNVTGERDDQSARVGRILMPVEQPKTGGLAGRMLDDDFLVGCMEQLVREGKAQGIDFRTLAGRQRYVDMKLDTEGKE
jgi:hypothetical protein